MALNGRVAAIGQCLMILLFENWNYLYIYLLLSIYIGWILLRSLIKMSDIYNL